MYGLQVHQKVAPFYHSKQYARRPELRQLHSGCAGQDAQAPARKRTQQRPHPHAPHHPVPARGWAPKTTCRSA